MMIPDGLQQKKIDGRPLYIRRQGKDGERGKGEGRRGHYTTTTHLCLDVGSDALGG